MTKQNIAIGIAALVLVGAAIATLTKSENPQGPDDLAAYSHPALGLEFAYRSGPDGYVVQEALPTAVDPSIVRLLHVVPAEAARDPAPEGGEGPAQISISIHRNTANQWSRQWAEAHPSYSAINLKQGEVAEAVVGGATAVRYMTDGLYAADVVVAAHGGLLYVFRGEFVDAESQLRKDFSPLIESVRFVPMQGATAGKLSINEICQGALAYMTFPDGVAAEKFVAECKEGKHPDVIERYRPDR